MPSNSLLTKGSSQKRGVEPLSIDIPFSPQKKVRGIECEAISKGKKVMSLRDMHLQNSSFRVDRVDYVKDELQEESSELRDMGDNMGEISEVEKCKILAKRAGKQIQGGGGWPSTVARSP